MGLFNHEGTLDRLVSSIESHPALSSAAKTAVETAIASGAMRHDAGGIRSRLDPLRKARRGGLIVAAGAAGLTAASAAVSSLRKRQAS